MLIAPHADAVTSSAAIKTSTFGVSKNPQKLVQVVVRSLYSNPTLATLVELGQNSHDEHKRCGKENIPFEVTLPTLFEPTLMVRDFGRGIPHNYMMGGYMNIFESTKDNDEDMSGGYGVGRCVVLSLSSTYTVITFIKGKKRTYSIFESDKGIELAHLGTEDTEEPDGTLVTAPVSQNDIYAFRDAAQRAYRYYKVPPIIKGEKNFVINTPKYTLEGDNWAIEENNNGSHAICGIYHYTIDVANMGKLSDNHRNLLSSIGLVLRFGPSDLDVQANRQGLHYNERTRENIVKALNKVEAEAASIIEDKFKNCKTYYEAKVLWGELFNDGTLRNLGRVAKNLNNIKWKGLPLEDDRIEVKGFQNVKNIYFGWRYNRAYGEYRPRHYYDAQYFECSSKYLLFINDLPGGRGAVQRLRAHLRELEVKTNEQYLAIAIHFKDDAAKQVFLKQTHLEESNFQSVAALPKPVITRGSNYNAERAKAKVFVFNEGASSKPSENWDIAEDIDLDEDGGIYVELDAYKPYAKSYHMQPSEFAAYYRNLKALGAFDNDEEIIGIRTTATDLIAKVGKSSKWKTLDKYVEEFMKNYKIPADEIQKMVDYDSYNGIYHNLKNIIEYGNEKHISHSKEFKGLIDKIKFMKKQVMGYQNVSQKYAQYVRMGGVINKVGVKPTYEVASDIAKFYSKYPILNHISNFYYDSAALQAVDQTLAKLEKLEEISLTSTAKSE